MKRNDKAKTISSVSFIKFKNEEATIDPALLFQRLIMSSSSSEIDLAEVMQYELCSFPPALFQSPTVLLKADKPKLSRALIAHVTANNSQPFATAGEGDTSYVLDGGSLLHRLRWHNDSTFRDIARCYASFVTANYGQATVVFDGYTSEYTIKDMTHNRRTNTIFPSVNFTPDMTFTGSKEM